MTTTPPTPFDLPQGDTDTAAVEILDQNGDVISGAVLDAGSGAVTSSDSTVLTATLSSDETSVALDGVAAGSATVDITGTVGGIALTGSLAVDVTAPAQVPTSIGLVPGTPVAPVG